MMATNDDDAGKGEKRKTAIDNSGSSSLPTLTPVVVIPALSLGIILKEFPDFLFCILPYIADRVIFNSIAGSNKNIYNQSKLILPPWPTYYILPFSHLWAWSPCGTRLACNYPNANNHYINGNIKIVDQRLGPVVLINENNNRPNPNYNNQIIDLKYSPDGSFLVSAHADLFIKLWDNVTGNYEQLQEWNMREDFADEFNNGIPKVSITPCSKYIMVSLGACAFMKDVSNAGKTIKSLIPPPGFGFSSVDYVAFICCREQNRGLAIKIWRPYLDIELDGHKSFTHTLSHDHTMVTIYDHHRRVGSVWSIAMGQTYITQKLIVPTNKRFFFTSDGKYIFRAPQNGSTLWSMVEHEFIDKTIHIVYLGYETADNIEVVSSSPYNRQIIIRDAGNFYLTTYVVK